MRPAAVSLTHDGACPEHQRWLEEVRFRVEQNDHMRKEVESLAGNNDRLSAKLHRSLILLAEIIGAGGIASEEQLEQARKLIQ